MSKILILEDAPSIAQGLCDSLEVEKHEVSVDNHVATRRAKLEPDLSSPRYLQTVHGVGYKPVRER